MPISVAGCVARVVFHPSIPSIHRIVLSNSFFPRAIDSWNIIMTHFDRYSNSFFPHGTLSLFHPIVTFGVHDPVGLFYFFQL